MQTNEQKRAVAALWKKAEDLRADRLKEKEALRLQLKESTARAQELVERRVEDFLGAHDERMSQLEEAHLQASKQASALDTALQNKRQEYEKETGESFNNLITNSTKKQKLSHEDASKPQDTAARIEEIKTALSNGADRRGTVCIHRHSLFTLVKESDRTCLSGIITTPHYLSSCACMQEQGGVLCAGTD